MSYEKILYRNNSYEIQEKHQAKSRRDAYVVGDDVTFYFLLPTFD